MTADDTPRLTPTQRLHEVTMAAMARRPSEPECSVTMSRNAKGATQFEVTGRGPLLGTVLSEVRVAFELLDNEYPYANGAGE